MSRFKDPQSPLFQALNSSLKFDQRLWPYDIAQSKAHVKMLASCDIISTDDRNQLIDGLEKVGAELESDDFPFNSEDEDIHMAIERRVTELVGSVGGKLHTARSRNDQVATDMAMCVRAHSAKAMEKTAALMRTLIELAEQHIDWVLPGYTHLQRAQPIYLSHHLLAYFWMLKRDWSRFSYARTQANRLPLGSGALAGVNFKTDRAQLAAELGFDSTTPNSVDSVSNRDFVLDYLAAASTCATHLSRLGSELVIWSSQEFGFCEVSDQFASGSSIMPQKKNPDAAELLRAKAPRVTSKYVALQGAMHALPLTYSKDMQEDKEGLFDAIDTLELCLEVAIEMLPGVTFNRERMQLAAGDEFIGATDVADLLVKRGMPFREAHGVVASLVRKADSEQRLLSDLTLEEIQEISNLLDESFYEVLKSESWLESKASEGGTAVSSVKQQVADAKLALVGLG